MQKFGTILGSVDGNLNRVVKIRRLWPEISGEVLAAHCEPVQIKGRILYVICDSPAWVQQMNLLGETVRPRIKQLCGVSVNKINARFGFVNRVTVSREPVRNKWQPDIDPADVSKIKSPELRRIFESMTGRKDSEGG